MNCITCKTGEMIESTTTYFTQVNDYYIIIENVPCLKCQQCGEELFRVSVARRLEKITHGIDLEPHSVKIMDYHQAA